MGKAPEPYYDPLEFAVERGAQARARAARVVQSVPCAQSRARSVQQVAGVTDHISRTHPALVKSYGTHLWLDPGEPGGREHSISVVLDVVKRYDIDGVHIDDYFYPVQGEGPARQRDRIPRRAELAAVRPVGRQAVARRLAARQRRQSRQADLRGDQGIEAVGEVRHQPVRHLAARAIRPGSEGSTSTQELYADSRLWLNKGWGDYFTPQLYWPIDRDDLSYTTLLEWWVRQNLHRAAHLARQLQRQGRHRRNELAVAGDPRPDRGHARAARRDRQRLLQHALVHERNAPGCPSDWRRDRTPSEHWCRLHRGWTTFLRRRRSCEPAAIRALERSR